MALQDNGSPCYDPALEEVAFMTWDFPDPFITQRTVASEDIDGMGHANNANYVKWCEDVAWSHSQRLGLSIKDYQRLDRGVAIRRGSYDYYAPSYVGDSLLLATWLTDCDRKLRLERKFQILHEKSGELVLRGEWQLICVVLSSGKATRFPTEFLSSYANAVVTSQA